MSKKYDLSDVDMEQAKQALRDMDSHDWRHVDESVNYSEYKQTMRDNDLDPDKYLKKPKSSYGSSSSSSDPLCFLTTACIRAKALPDDCDELEILRTYRDRYLRNRPGGEADIAEYYTVAPKIVAAIDRRQDADRCWQALYDDLVTGCIRLIGRGEMEETYRLYRDTVRSLREQYLS